MILNRLIALIFLMSLALTACHTKVTKSGQTSGHIGPQNTDKALAPLALSFDKSSYSKSDTIKLLLLNKTETDILIALRCGSSLEMFYQKSENGEWSENKEFSYMRMRCPTHVYTIKPHEQYDFSLPADRFSSTGSYRLLVPFTITTENNDQTITSIPFEIR